MCDKTVYAWAPPTNEQLQQIIRKYGYIGRKSQQRER